MKKLLTILLTVLLVVTTITFNVAADPVVTEQIVEEEKNKEVVEEEVPEILAEDVDNAEVIEEEGHFVEKNEGSNNALQAGQENTTYTITLHYVDETTKTITSQEGRSSTQYISYSQTLPTKDVDGKVICWTTQKGDKSKEIIFDDEVHASAGALISGNHYIVNKNMDLYAFWEDADTYAKVTTIDQEGTYILAEGASGYTNPAIMLSDGDGEQASYDFRHLSGSKIKSRKNTLSSAEVKCVISGGNKYFSLANNNLYLDTIWNLGWLVGFNSSDKVPVQILNSGVVQIKHKDEWKYVYFDQSTFNVYYWDFGDNYQTTSIYAYRKLEKADVTITPNLVYNGVTRYYSDIVSISHNTTALDSENYTVKLFNSNNQEINSITYAGEYSIVISLTTKGSQKYFFENEDTTHTDKITIPFTVAKAEVNVSSSKTNYPFTGDNQLETIKDNISVVANPNLSETNYSVNLYSATDDSMNTPLTEVKEVGNYKAIVKLNDNTFDNYGIGTDRKQTEIIPISIDATTVSVVPELLTSFTYTGEEKEVKPTDFDSNFKDYMTLTTDGDCVWKGTDAKTYTGLISLKEGFEWDKTTLSDYEFDENDNLKFTWAISPAEISSVIFDDIECTEFNHTSSEGHQFLYNNQNQFPYTGENSSLLIKANEGNITLEEGELEKGDDEEYHVVNGDYVVVYTANDELGTSVDPKNVGKYRAYIMLSDNFDFASEKVELASTYSAGKTRKARKAFYQLFEITPAQATAKLNKTSFNVGSIDLIPSVTFTGKDAMGKDVAISLTKDDEYTVSYYKDGDVNPIADITKVTEPGSYKAVFTIDTTKNPNVLFDVTEEATEANVATVEFAVSSKTKVIPIQTNNLVYNGMYQMPTFNEGVEVVGRSKFIRKIDAGTYEVKVKLTDPSNTEWADSKDVDRDGNKTVTWTINRREATIKVSSISKVYGDPDPKEIEIVFGTVTDTTGIIKKDQVLFKATRKVGEDVRRLGYEIDLTIKNLDHINKNYIIHSDLGRFYITKAPLTVSLKDKELVYTSEDQIPKLVFTTLKNSDTLKEGKYADYQISVVSKDIKNVGQKEIVVVLNDNSRVLRNYTYSKYTALSYKITEAKVDVTWNTETFKYIYDKESHVPTPTLTATLGNGKQKVLTEGKDYIAFACDQYYVPNTVDVGKKYEFVILNSDNYGFNSIKPDAKLPNELVSEENKKYDYISQEYEIVPAHVKATLSKDSYQYDSMPHCPTITVTVLDGNLAKKELVEDVNIHHTDDYRVIRPTLQEQIVVGDNKEITVTLNKNNFVFEDNTNETKLSYSITKKPVYVKWVGQSSFEYNGKEQLPQVVFEKGGVVVGDYGKVNVEAYATSFGKEVDSIDAGYYVANTRLTGERASNYEIVGYITSIPFTITPKTVHVHWDVKDYVYDGEKHSPNLVFDDETYSEDNIDYFQIDLRLGDLPEDKKFTEDELMAMIDEAQRANGADLYRFEDAGEYCSFALITGKTSNYHFVGTNEDDPWYDDVDPWIHRIAYTDFTIDQRDLKVLWSDKVKFKYNGKEQGPDILGAVAIIDGEEVEPGIVARDEGVVELKLDITNGKKIKPGSNYKAEAVLASKGTNHRANNYRIVENKTINFKIYRTPREDTTPVKTGVDR